MDERSFVHFTGFATAYFRAAESCRPDRIINDPFAEKLAGDTGAQFLSLLSRWGPSQDSAMDMLAIRTRYLDEVLAKRNPAILQVVNLACGMDSRAFRLDAMRGCHVFELDRSEDTLSHKQRTLCELGAEAKAKKVDYIVADLASDAWEQALFAHGFEPTQPTFWIMEGLLYYLDRSSIVKLLKAVDAHSAPGSQLSVDMCGQSTISSERFGIEGLKFGEDNPTGGILSLLYWDLKVVASFDEPGTHFGREWTPLPLSDDSSESLKWFIVEGSKPAHRDAPPVL
jgi:methyltransferase (TIGR00027 family)